MTDDIRELFKKEEEKIKREMFEKAMQKSELSAEELWMLPAEEFNLWRKKYDYPRIIKNIKDNQKGFQDWMNEFEITDEILMDASISDCISPKLLSNNKTKHIIKVKYKGKSSHQVWHEYDGITSSSGDGEDVLYEYIKSFMSYEDWCHKNGFHVDILSKFFRYEPNTPNEQVYLNHNIRLLKMGGIRPPVNPIGVLLRGKKIEFVNLCGLELRGTIYFGDMGNLECHYCAADHIRCDSLDMPLIYFQFCSITDLQIVNTKTNSWDFINCTVTGLFKESRLSHFRIYGGSFIPIISNCHIDDFDIKFEGLPHVPNFERIYRTLYKSALENGSYEEATEFKLLEKEYIRKKSQTEKRRIMTFEKWFWGYGYQPKKILLNTIYIILAYAVFYSFFPGSFERGSHPSCSMLLDGLYFSVVTFTTLGYGDISPIGLMRIISCSEALVGIIVLGFLIVGLSKNPE